ncbi:MAG: hypothetical protein ABI068_16185 [Ktedonobacterales bacterium]
METQVQAYLTATRFSLLEHARNRFAVGLLLIFVPLWYWLLGLTVGNISLVFRFGATGKLITVNGYHLVLLSTGLNTITLITGFTLFAATRSGARFDRRLILSGYAQLVLLLAKMTALVAVAALVALYATLVLLVFWRPEGLALIWVAYFLGALIYGALGLLFGVLLKSELAGFFLIIMISLMDTFFQNPFENPFANKPFLQWFPSYAPTQYAVAGAFTADRLWWPIGVSLLWFVGLALMGLAIFWLRTRAWNRNMVHMAGHTTSSGTPQPVSA